MTDDDSIKVGDFGVSRQIDSTINVTTHQGTFQYMSPEVRAHIEYSYNTDCWSLGCVFYELITLVRFYRAERIETDDVIQTEIRDLNTLDLFKKILSMMLLVNKDERERQRELFNYNNIFLALELEIICA